MMKKPTEYKKCIHCGDRDCYGKCDANRLCDCKEPCKASSCGAHWLFQKMSERNEAHPHFYSIENYCTECERLGCRCCLECKLYHQCNCYGQLDNDEEDDRSWVSYPDDAYEDTMNDDAYEDTMNDDAYEDTMNDDVYEDTMNDDVYEDTMNDDVYEDTMNDDVYEDSMNDDVYEDSMNDDAVLETLRLFFERVDKSDNTTVSISEPPITVSNESIIHAHAAEIVRKNRTFVRRLNPCHPDYEAYECDSDDGWS